MTDVCPQMQREMGVQRGTIPIPNPHLEPEGVQHGTLPSRRTGILTRNCNHGRNNQGVHRGTEPCMYPGGVQLGTLPPGERRINKLNLANTPSNYKQDEIHQT
eukprot:2824193-Karenia_brevis.AAC.1